MPAGNQRKISERALDDPVLGHFDPQGRYQFGRSVRKTLVSKDRLSLKKKSAASFELSFVREAEEVTAEKSSASTESWYPPFCKPKAALYRQGGLAVLDRTGDTIGIWDSDGNFEGAVPCPSPVSSYRGSYRLKSSLIIPASEGRALKLADTQKGSRLPKLAFEKDVEQKRLFSTDTFAVIADFVSGSLSVAYDNFEGESITVAPWYRLPGTGFSRAHWLKPDVAVLANQEGLYPLKINPTSRHELFKVHSAYADNVSSRHDNLLILSGSKDRQQLSVNSNGHLTTKTLPATFGQQRFGSIEFDQPVCGPPKSITIHPSSGSKISLADEKQHLSIDRPLLLGSIRNQPGQEDDILLGLPVGFHRLNGDRSTKFANLAKGVAGQMGSRLKILRSNSGAVRFAGDDDRSQISFEPMQLKPASSDFRAYIHFGGANGWKAYSEKSRLLIRRPVPGLVDQFDTLKAPNIFVRGQFAFDHVTRVDQRDDGSMTITTSEGMELLEQRDSGFTLHRIPGSPPAVDPFQIPSNSDSRFMFENLSIPEFVSNNSIPGRGAFEIEANDRVWIVNQTKIYMIEAGSRWYRSRQNWFSRH